MILKRKFKGSCELDCTQSLSFLLVIERLERARIIYTMWCGRLFLENWNTNALDQFTSLRYRIELSEAEYFCSSAWHGQHSRNGFPRWRLPLGNPTSQRASKPLPSTKPQTHNVRTSERVTAAVTRFPTRTLCVCNRPPGSLPQLAFSFLRSILTFLFPSLLSRHVFLFCSSLLPCALFVSLVVSFFFCSQLLSFCSAHANTKK